MRNQQIAIVHQQADALQKRKEFNSLYKSFTNKAQTLIKPRYALLALILLNIVIALYIGNHFGEGWDESTYYRYGERSLEAYIRGLSGLELIPKRHIFFSNLRYYGPFYAVAGKVSTDLLTNVLKNWSYEDIWHFVNFIFFQGALIGLYSVAKRFMRLWIAFVTVLLLATQPLIFGHSFINPKDIPFMTFFLASIASGLIMADAIKTKEVGSSNYTMPILFGLLILSIVTKDIISSFIANLVSFFYYSSPTSIWGRLFSLIADQANRLPLENYIHKAVTSIQIVPILIAAIFVYISINLLKNNYKKGDIQKTLYSIDFQLIFKVLIAGIFLGLTTSIRILGPFAGLLIMGQALMSAGKKSLPGLIYYFSIATLTSYLTWPFLWDEPAHHFFEAFDVMKNFPFEGIVKFMGNNYTPGNLPWIYIPALIIFQITIPAIVLFVVGFISSFLKFIKNIDLNKSVLLLYAWFIIPIGLFILLKSSAYDNFRQFFFVLPPIFILAGMGLDTILKNLSKYSAQGGVPAAEDGGESNFRIVTTKLINRKSAGMLLITATLLPGIIGILMLHPYEYMYYNSFAGGFSVASKNFDTDYWATSYREAATYLNSNAPLNSRILVWGARYNVEHNARADLQVYGFSSEAEVLESYDYAVISTRSDVHLVIYPNAETVFEVRKNGVLLAVVKKLTK